MRGQGDAGEREGEEEAVRVRVMAGVELVVAADRVGVCSSAVTTLLDVL